jgi:hypothetical protein
MSLAGPLANPVEGAAFQQTTSHPIFKEVFYESPQ